MFCVIEEEEIRTVEEGDFHEKDDAICILTEEEWESADKFREYYKIRIENPQIHLCKMESHLDYLYATMRIPKKDENESSFGFAFYLLPEKIIFIDNENTVQKQIEKLAGKKLRNGYSLERFLYDFLVSFFEEDLLFLQKLEQKINRIEEEVLKGRCQNFNIRMLNLKKKIAKFYRYYTQMTEIGQELLDNETDFFEKEALRLFDRLKDRAARLASETQLLREYAMQVQDVYQSEIGIRQNDVMKVLTVVTTIFLPLTLIAGWYGMNFVNMPELTYRYGYPIIIAVSIVIVVLSLIIFKKKKYW
jgi:magnesium transporter